MPDAPGRPGLPDELDLTLRPGEAEDSGGLNLPRERPYDPVPEREQKRGLIALVLVYSLCGIIVLAVAFDFVVPGNSANIDVLKALLEIIFASFVGLVGAATGFYFGEKSR